MKGIIVTDITIYTLCLKKLHPFCFYNNLVTKLLPK